MHELSIAQGIVDIVQQSIPAGHPGKVEIVRVKVGELSGIVADSLEFCFSAITQETPLEGALLVIEHVATTAECRTCGCRSRVADLLFLCPVCGGGDLTLLSGRELQVTEIELSDAGKDGS
jgi:hydrogenase nickel incorporation protein HypA/HybF